ncbi:hypothetical protein QTP86_021102, partial [Hemibagrus guttatus]
DKKYINDKEQISVTNRKRRLAQNNKNSTDEPNQPDPTVRPEESELTIRSKKKSKSSVRPEQSESQSTTQERVTPKNDCCETPLGALPTPDSFLRSRVFVWRPVGVWRCSLKCPRGDKCVGKGWNVHLYKSGYHHRVRHICDVSSWYTMLTEVLCSGPSIKAARSGEGSTVSRWLAWDPAILSQLSEAHRAMFPAVLTSRRVG